MTNGKAPKGPMFRKPEINIRRKLGFNLDRDLPFGKVGVSFREKGVMFRPVGVSFGDRGVSNINLAKKDNPDVLASLGVRLMTELQFAKALKYFDRALEVQPQNKIAKHGRATCLRKIHDQHATEVNAIQPGTIAQRRDYEARRQMLRAQGRAPPPPIPPSQPPRSRPQPQSRIQPQRTGTRTTVQPVRVQRKTAKPMPRSTQSSQRPEQRWQKVSEPKTPREHYRRIEWEK